MTDSPNVSRVWPRLTGVTVGLLAAGAAIGATLGAGLLAILGRVVDGAGGFPYVWDAFVVAGAAGALLGALGLPIIAWTILRHVALGRVVAETALGTVLGGTVGLLTTGLDPFLAIAGAFAGFLGSALLLRVRRPPDASHTRRPTSR